jgi:hypothetical protein
LEKWELGLDLLLNSVENFTFPLNSNWALFIKYHAKNVLPLDNRNALLDHIFTDTVQNDFEKLLVIVKLYPNIRNVN